jgi:PAS domain-containing protein
MLPTIEPSIATCATSFSQIAESLDVPTPAIDSLLAELPVGVLLVDRAGRAVYANSAARALQIERLEPVQWAITRALLTEDAVREDEIEIATPGRPKRWLSVHVVPIRLAGFGVNAAFVLLSDVTARTQMNAWNPVIETLVAL